MADWIQSLPDGWTIYVWMVVGAGILVGVVFGIRWASRNAQFDEDIKYVVFDETDKERMEPEEYAKYKEVMATQEEARREHLKRKAEERSAKHANR